MSASYSNAFKKLHVSRSRGPAPHKPLLLLSVLEEIENGSITENKIYITPELVSLFKFNWSLLVDSNIFSPQFALPFYHLKTDKFWHLITKAGKEIELTSSNSIKSLSSLSSVLDYACFDSALYFELLNPTDRTIYREILLDWFPNTKSNYLKHKSTYKEYFFEYERKILEEKSENYIREIEKADEEEQFVRSGVFKKVVPKIYNYTCCISEMRVTTTSNIQMIDACHIIPFSDSHNDTIGNGISLCPNLHRAFDRGLISIDDNYCVIVSPIFHESIESNYSIKKYNGKEILLPKEKEYYPDLDCLKWHLKNKFIH